MANDARIVCPFCGQVHDTDDESSHVVPPSSGWAREPQQDWSGAIAAAPGWLGAYTAGYGAAGETAGGRPDLFRAAADPVELAAPNANSVPPSGDPAIDGLLQGSRWALDASRTLTFAFYPNFLQGIVWTEFGKQQIRLALFFWERVANIHFVEVAPVGTFNNNSTNMSFWILADYAVLPPGIVAMAGFPDPQVNDQILNQILAPAGLNQSFYPTIEGDVFFNFFAPGSPNLGGLIFYAALHEIGHALGLKHPHDDGGRGKPTFAGLGLQSLDSDLYTVMSYHFGGNLETGNAVLPMILDIKAIQYLYGANLSTSTGDDRYVYFDNQLVVRGTIWDAGGIDTLDASAVTTPAIMDLRPGELSRYGPGLQIIDGNAYGVALEHAVGGKAADIITGNGLANRLEGRAGNDFLIGNGGNDTADGGQGADLILGNDGNDTVIGGDGNDTLAGSGFETTAQGGNDSLSGGPGADTLYVLDGIDTADGGDGADTITAYAGSAHSLVGGNGADAFHLIGGYGGVDGGQGNDTVVAYAGSGYAAGGGDGADDFVLLGGAGSVNGGAGNDTIATFAGSQFWAVGGADADVFLFIGGGGIFDGADGNDLFLGFGGTGQSVFGGNGNDVFVNLGPAAMIQTGGPGTDAFIAGPGADIFTYASDFGVDVISGFDRATGDRIRLAPNINASAIATPDQARARTVTDGQNVLLVLGPDLIIVTGLTQLLAGDFLIG